MKQSNQPRLAADTSLPGSAVMIAFPQAGRVHAVGRLAERMALIHAINADPELSASAVAVALALMSFVNSKAGECFPPFEGVMARCRVSKKTVATATQDLERRRWVAIERDEGGDRETNRYH